ncbi:MAG: CpsD/CapB family tyrosine-protein kinase [Lachnospiraceae bacterium]|nr:CpsD/CapB family tyrosine-protein kinase [Lachnospiraceae bacterium]
MEIMERRRRETRRMPGKKKNQTITVENERNLIGDKLDFAASEAYKLLRTNLMLSLTDEKSCHVIGITSSVAGEGKSSTAVNLAYFLAETDKRVLYIEADMRMPVLAERINMPASPGLSNYLAGMCGINDAFRKSNIHNRLYVVTAGDVPPNPSELLASAKMEATLNALSERFDYIIMDLPPVNVVADALIVSKMVDGIVLVVRKNYCRKKTLSEAIRRLKYLNARVLGIVMTRADYQEKKYSGKYGGYGKYGQYGKYAIKKEDA